MSSPPSLAKGDVRLMGDSYREEVRKRKTRSGYSEETLVREGTALRAKVREQYFRKSLARRREILKAAQKRLIDA